MLRYLENNDAYHRYRLYVVAKPQTLAGSKKITTPKVTEVIPLKLWSLLHRDHFHIRL